MVRSADSVTGRGKRSAILKGQANVFLKLKSMSESPRIVAFLQEGTESHPCMKTSNQEK